MGKEESFKRVMHERGVKVMRLNVHCGIVSEALVCGYFNTFAEWVSKRANRLHFV